MKLLTLFFLAFSLIGRPNIPQDTTVSFSKMVHDFGDFGLDDGPQSFTFTMKNNGTKPVVIQTVISSCGCTTPEWTKEPVLPGKTGKITATFLNNQGPYPFDKTLSVYLTGSNTPHILRIRGMVHEKEFSVEDTHPVKMGDIRLRKSTLELGQIKQGQVKTDSVEIINVGKMPVILAFTGIHDANLSVRASTRKLNPQEKGVIIYTIDTRNKEEWGNVIYPFQLVMNDKTQTAWALTVKASIKMNSLDYTREQKDKAPIPQADKSAVEFTDRVQGTPVEATFVLSNKGKTPLIIYKADFSHEGIDATIPTTIAPSEKATIKVSIPKTTGFGDVIYTISLTTNAPSRPTVNLLIYGKLTK